MKKAAEAEPRRRKGMKLCGLQPLTEYVRSPSSALVDNTTSPIFLPTVPDRKPRTECGNQPVAFISSFEVAPPGRLTGSRILAVLLPSRATVDLATSGLVRPLGAFLPLRANLALAGATLA